MRLKVIACDVLFREVCHWAARVPATVDLRFLSRSLHNDPDDLRAEIQAEIDRSDGYDAVALGYGLCSNAGAYLHARHAPLVLPRAHDCITLYLGSRERYRESFGGSPGTYYYTAGWIERAGTRVERTSDDTRGTHDQTYRDYVRRFGEENARYLMETLHSWWKHYTRAAFIEMAVPGADEIEESSREQAKAVAREYGWEYEEIPGDLGLFGRLLRGDWCPDEFLVAAPGTQIVPSYEDGVVEATAEAQPIPPRAPRVL